MTESLADLIDWTEAHLWLGFAVLLRIGAMMAFLPAFGEQAVPARVKAGLTVALTVLVAPAVAGQISAPPLRPSLLGLILMAEVVTGLLFGLILRLAIMALATAGALIAQGLALAQMFGAGPAAEPLPVFSHLLVGAGLALAAALGLHVEAVGFILGSYSLVPFALVPGSGIVLEEAVNAIAKSFGSALVLAAPFLIGSLVYNLAIGVINRAMPQLMVTFIGAPFLTLGGLAMLALTAPFALSHWASMLAATVTMGPLQ
jgi:flagellar biosynthetic protein FliR